MYRVELFACIVNNIHKLYDAVLGIGGCMITHGCVEDKFEAVEGNLTKLAGSILTLWQVYEVVKRVWIDYLNDTDDD